MAVGGGMQHKNEQGGGRLYPCVPPPLYGCVCLEPIFSVGVSVCKKAYVNWCECFELLYKLTFEGGGASVT